jgi:hypothetical protein
MSDLRFGSAILFCVLVLAAGGSALASDEGALTEAVMACGDVENAVERLGCFDEVQRDLRARLVREAMVARADDAADITQAGAKNSAFVVTGGNLAERYRGEGPRSVAEKTARIDEERLPFSRPVQEVRLAADGKLIVTLVDGLSFRQNDTVKIRRSMLSAKDAEFRPGMFDSWFMRLDGRGQSVRMVQVE